MKPFIWIKNKIWRNKIYQRCKDLDCKVYFFLNYQAISNV